MSSLESAAVREGRRRIVAAAGARVRSVEVQAQEVTAGDGKASQEIDIGLIRSEGLQCRDDPGGELAGGVLLRAP